MGAGQGTGSAIVELRTAAPFATFGDHAAAPLLRFLASPAPADPDVVSVVGVDAARSARADGHRCLAVLVGSIAELGALGDVTPDFIVLTPEATAGPQAEAVTAAIAAYARASSVELVATGIDDQHQYERLRQLGVRYGAGPHIDRRRAAGERLVPAHTARERTDALRSRLDALDDAADVAVAVCEHVSQLGLLPSVYVERNGLLRCLAQRGYWQVMDGIPVGMGVIGRTFRRGRGEHIEVSDEDEFIAAAPGLAAEIATPIQVDGTVRAVFSVECTRSFQQAELHELERIGAELQRALQRVGIDGGTTALHSLARAQAELASSPDETTVAHTAVRMACTVAGTSSAMIALPGSDGTLRVRAAAGPLSTVLRRLDRTQMRDLTDELGGISSCMAGGDEDGHIQPVFDDIRRRGGTSLVVFPVRCEGHDTGLLFVADEMPGGLGVEQREAMELLAGAIARTFDHVRVNEALRLRAEQDSLTMVGSRGAFDEALDALDAADGEPIAVVLADIDWFKQVNDRFGHVTGDQVLVDTAQAMLECLRQDDRLFRIGGDEFAILVPGVDLDAARRLAERLVGHAGTHLHGVAAGLSIGVAVREDGETMQQCVVRADRCLYEAKAARADPVR
jgi:diguanylate cyclase (GGDEF)-like protein